MEQYYFGINLKFLRKNKRMTQAELAKALGKGESTISLWESSSRKPVVADILDVCKYFNVTIFDMIDRDLSIPGAVPTKEEMELFELYRQLKKEQQSSIIQIMKAMIE